MEAQKKAFTHSAGQDMNMSVDQRSLLSEQPGFPAECVGFHVDLHVTTDALQGDIKLRFILRRVWILKTIPSRADLEIPRAAGRCARSEPGRQFWAEMPRVEIGVPALHAGR